MTAYNLVLVHGMNKVRLLYLADISLIETVLWKIAFAVPAVRIAQAMAAQAITESSNSTVLAVEMSSVFCTYIVT